MDVERRRALEVMEQVLAVRLGVDQGQAVEPGRAGGEPALRAGDPHRATGEERPMPRGKPVNGVSLWHPRTLAGLSP
nr:hypothetical protein GCM10020092_014430 [Actinoplanes digitatis]